jgi:HK97 family phage prohead protease
MIEKFLNMPMDTAANNLGPRQVMGIASRTELDDMGDITVAAGVLPEKGNVPLLFQHMQENILGRADYWRDGSAVKALVTFADAGIDAQIDRICALCKTGVLTAFSVGFHVLQSEPIKGTRCKKYTQWKLLELSVVSVPALQSAQIQARGFKPGIYVPESRPNESLAQRVLRERMDHIQQVGTVDDAVLRSERIIRAERLRRAGEW